MRHQMSHQQCNTFYCTRHRKSPLFYRTRHHKSPIFCVRLRIVRYDAFSCSCVRARCVCARTFVLCMRLAAKLLIMQMQMIYSTPHCMLQIYTHTDESPNSQNARPCVSKMRPFTPAFPNVRLPRFRSRPLRHRG